MPGIVGKFGSVLNHETWLSNGDAKRAFAPLKMDF